VSVLSVVCPGSFDPVTNGHLDIIERAARLADTVYVAVLHNDGKRKTSMFTVQERIDLILTATPRLDNLVVEGFDGLLVDYCSERGVAAIVRGVRAMSDFDYELQMAQMNHRLAGVDTFFVATNPAYSYLSSSLLKEVAAYGGDISGLVPDHVDEALRRRLAEHG
jgi:pantetheine-phosphate adenylyltransferase